MTTLSPEESLQIVKVFFKSRPMKIHWIQIPENIRNLLSKLLDENNLDNLSNI